MSKSTSVPARPLGLPVLLWAGLALVAAGTAALLDAASGSPLWVQLGATLTRAATDVAGVACVGLALVGVLAPRAARLSGALRRSRAQLQLELDRALVVVSGIWVAMVLVSIGFRAADAFGRSLAELSGRELSDWSIKLAAGRGLLLTAGCAAAVLVCAVLRLRRPEQVQNRLPLVLALFGMLTPGVTGHAGSSPDHQLAVVTVALHTGAAALWVGGLGVVLATLTRRPVLLDAVLPRFSTLAGGCLFTVGLTGLANALLRMSSFGALFSTPYGWLVLAKTGALILLAGLGGLARRRLRSGQLPVLRWAGAEVALMAVTLGLAAALTQTAS